MRYTPLYPPAPSVRVALSLPHPVDYRGTVHHLKRYHGNDLSCGTVTKLSTTLLLPFGVLDQGRMKACKRCWEQR